MLIIYIPKETNRIIRLRATHLGIAKLICLINSHKQQPIANWMHLIKGELYSCPNPIKPATNSE